MFYLLFTIIFIANQIINNIVTKITLMTIINIFLLTNVYIQINLLIETCLSFKYLKSVIKIVGSAHVSVGSEFKLCN